jgi:hypothetical protein
MLMHKSLTVCCCLPVYGLNEHDAGNGVHLRARALPIISVSLKTLTCTSDRVFDDPLTNLIPQVDPTGVVVTASEEAKDALGVAQVGLRIPSI